MKEGNLVIVESPAKAGTIQKFLGKDFVVKSSFGHIRDLHDKDLSIDVEHGFKPEYVIPQILFQIISERSDLMGVSYTSTRMEHVDFRDSKQRNFVLIVPKADQSQGQSEVLAESLTCTMPISPEVGEDSLAVERKLNGMKAMKMSFLAKEM